MNHPNHPRNVYNSELCVRGAQWETTALVVCGAATKTAEARQRNCSASKKLQRRGKTQQRIICRQAADAQQKTAIINPQVFETLGFRFSD